MSFRALVVRNENEVFSAKVEQLTEAALPDGDVVVDVGWTGLNYKDGLCLTGGGGLVRTYPHVPGIDFSGTVNSSRDSRYSVGDLVVLTGWRVGEAWWGGYAQKASVKADWLVKLPAKLSTRQAMCVGTAGLTAMLAINRLEGDGMRPQHGPVLVTGASGGVGTVAILLLSKLGYEIAALTGRPENANALKAIGATQIVDRKELEVGSNRPLLSQTWGGAIDSVGGPILANVLKQMKVNASVAAVGLAASADLPTGVLPFILRGVSLLGIDSVMQPQNAREQAWKRLSEILDFEKLEAFVREARLEDLPELGQQILDGKIKGRVVCDPNIQD